MSNLRRGLLPLLALSLVILSSCSKNDEPDDGAIKGRVLLIYAVASNSLSYNLGYDIEEMLRVAPNLDLKHNALLVYSVVPGGECRLERMQKAKNGGYELALVKSYPDVPLSVEKERITDVLGYVADSFPDAKKGLVLWSHATGWVPWFGASAPMFSKRKAFGQDIYQNTQYWCNITTLAESIPEGVFDYIWFDCCYMANIETVYELKEKADNIVGYVTEIHQDGMPYDLTLPYLLRENADLNAAAEALYRYYDEDYIPVTVSVIKTSELYRLADVSAEVFGLGTTLTGTGRLQNYSRIYGEPFYDMRQLLKSYPGVSEALKSRIDDAFEAAVTCKYASPRDFSGKEIVASEYSGLSIHDFVDNGTGNNEFYKTLSWYIDTRK